MFVGNIPFLFSGAIVNLGRHAALACYKELLSKNPAVSDVNCELLEDTNFLSRC